jgi:hypothetical protein
MHKLSKNRERFSMWSFVAKPVRVTPIVVMIKATKVNKGPLTYYPLLLGLVRFGAVINTIVHQQG